MRAQASPRRISNQLSERHSALVASSFCFLRKPKVTRFFPHIANCPYLPQERSVQAPRGSAEQGATGPTRLPKQVKISYKQSHSYELLTRREAPKNFFTSNQSKNSPTQIQDLHESHKHFKRSVESSSYENYLEHTGRFAFFAPAERPAITT